MKWGESEILSGVGKVLILVGDKERKERKGKGEKRGKFDSAIERETEKETESKKERKGRELHSVGVL